MNLGSSSHLPSPIAATTSSITFPPTPNLNWFALCVDHSNHWLNLNTTFRHVQINTLSPSVLTNTLTLDAIATFSPHNINCISSTTLETAIPSDICQHVISIIGLCHDFMFTTDNIYRAPMVHEKLSTMLSPIVLKKLFPIDIQPIITHNVQNLAESQYQFVYTQPHVQWWWDLFYSNVVYSGTNTVPSRPKSLFFPSNSAFRTVIAQIADVLLFISREFYYWVSSTNCPSLAYFRQLYYQPTSLLTDTAINEEDDDAGNSSIHNFDEWEEVSSVEQPQLEHQELMKKYQRYVGKEVYSNGMIVDISDDDTDSDADNDNDHENNKNDKIKRQQSGTATLQEQCDDLFNELLNKFFISNTTDVQPEQNDEFISQQYNQLTATKFSQLLLTPPIWSLPPPIFSRTCDNNNVTQLESPTIQQLSTNITEFDSLITNLLVNATKNVINNGFLPLLEQFATENESNSAGVKKIDPIRLSLIFDEYMYLLRQATTIAPIDTHGIPIMNQIPPLSDPEHQLTSNHPTMDDDLANDTHQLDSTIHADPTNQVTILPIPHQLRPYLSINNESAYLTYNYHYSISATTFSNHLIAYLLYLTRKLHNELKVDFLPREHDMLDIPANSTSPNEEDLKTITTLYPQIVIFCKILMEIPIKIGSFLQYIFAPNAQSLKTDDITHIMDPKNQDILTFIENDFETINETDNIDIMNDSTEVTSSDQSQNPKKHPFTPLQAHCIIPEQMTQYLLAHTKPKKQANITQDDLITFKKVLKKVLLPFIQSNHDKYVNNYVNLSIDQITSGNYHHILPPMEPFYYIVLIFAQQSQLLLNNNIFDDIILDWTKITKNNIPYDNDVFYTKLTTFLHELSTNDEFLFNQIFAMIPTIRLPTISISGKCSYQIITQPPVNNVNLFELLCLYGQNYYMALIVPLFFSDTSSNNVLSHLHHALIYLYQEPLYHNDMILCCYHTLHNRLEEITTPKIIQNNKKTTFCSFFWPEILAYLFGPLVYQRDHEFTQILPVQRLQFFEQFKPCYSQSQNIVDDNVTYYSFNNHNVIDLLTFILENIPLCTNHLITPDNSGVMPQTSKEMASMYQKLFSFSNDLSVSLSPYQFPTMAMLITLPQDELSYLLNLIFYNILDIFTTISIQHNKIENQHPTDNYITLFSMPVLIWVFFLLQHHIPQLTIDEQSMYFQVYKMFKNVFLANNKVIYVVNFLQTNITFLGELYCSGAIYLNHDQIGQITEAQRKNKNENFVDTVMSDNDETEDDYRNIDEDGAFLLQEAIRSQNFNHLFQFTAPMMLCPSTKGVCQNKSHVIQNAMKTAMIIISMNNYMLQCILVLLEKKFRIR